MRVRPGRPDRVVAAGLVAAGLLVTGLLAAGCTSAEDEPGAAAPAPAPTPAQESPGRPGADPALSSPVEDSVYPEVGDPGVDALHYDLTLRWAPEPRQLRATERLTFRAAADAPRFQLDLGEPLEVASVRVDGAPAAYEHDGKDLVVTHEVRRDRRYTAVIRYAGTPEPVPAPTARSDFDAIGWTVTDDGAVWTMQEPYGAYSWYAVNDQPSDKARYDIRVRVPQPMVGVANGELRSRRTVGGDTVTRWRLDEPAASYLITVAIDDFETATDESRSGVPISYWVPRDRPDLLESLRAAPAGLDWLEARLGDYPFDTLGFVIVESQSGMETQTMITLGGTPYATSPEVLVHEMAHHWYGDQVTPADWRDVWMNEGMAMYLQAVWQDEHQDQSLDEMLARWAALDPGLRATYGPPADYDPRAFAASNVYTTPAVMWDEVRTRLGEELFWRLVREWPAAHDNGHADYDTITTWWSEHSGVDLAPLFDAWLRGETTPPRTG